MKFSAIAIATVAAFCTIVQGAALPAVQTLDRRQFLNYSSDNVYNVKAQKIMSTDSAMNDRIISDLNTLQLDGLNGTALYSITKPFSSISNFVTLKLSYGVEPQVKKFSWYNTMYMDSVGYASGESSDSSDSGCLGMC
ncbi:hypothetical protein H4R33_005153 [Dimargaris cristalligena]|nr:hypothetical protein H4R33_005153 [Dimargaris cristalligena]